MAYHWIDTKTHSGPQGRGVGLTPGWKGAARPALLRGRRTPALRHRRPAALPGSELEPQSQAGTVGAAEQAPRAGLDGRSPTKPDSGTEVQGS